MRDMVKVYRPPSSKVATRYSEPREIVDITSATTRTVRRSDGRESLEYVVNLLPWEDAEPVTQPDTVTAPDPGSTTSPQQPSPPKCSVNGRGEELLEVNGTEERNMTERKNHTLSKINLQSKFLPFVRYFKTMTDKTVHETIQTTQTSTDKVGGGGCCEHRIINIMVYNSENDYLAKSKFFQVQHGDYCVWWRGNGLIGLFVCVSQQLDMAP